jgi:hypothetical protein
MRILFSIFCACLIAVGGIWILQGLNIIQGSYMFGPSALVWRGAGLAVAGIVLLILISPKSR